MSAEHSPDLDEVARRLDRARGAAHAGASVPEGTRLRLLKRAVVAAMRPVTSIQQVCNEALISAVDGLRTERSTTESAITALRASTALTDGALDEIDVELRSLRDEVAALRAQVGAPPAEG